MRELVERFGRVGYCVASGYFTDERIGSLEDALEAAIRSVLGPSRARRVERSALFHRELIELYERDPGLGAEVYDTINRDPALRRLFDGRRLRTLIGRLTGRNPEELVAGDHQFLIQRPEVTRHLLGWHQDGAYFGDRFDSRCSVVVWLPLFGCGLSDGALWVIPGSHGAGTLRHETNPFGRHKDGPLETRGRVYIEPRMIDEREAIQVEVGRGDVGIFHMDLIHKSGLPMGERVRHTAIARIGVARPALTDCTGG